MPRVHFVKKARKDNPAVKKGESYYHWTFRYGGKQYSATYPKQSQLTQSPFLSAYYDLQERITKMRELNLEDLEAEKEDLVTEIETLLEEAQDSLENIPEHLQESHMLYERVEQTQEWLDAVEGVDAEVDLEEITAEYSTEGLDEDEAKDTIAAMQQAMDDKKEEIVGELEAADPGIG